jgi:hypothetical protein
MPSPKSNIAILLQTASYQMNFNTLIGSSFKSNANFKIQKTNDQNGNQAYAYKLVNMQESASFTNIQFPAALSHGNSARMQELKQKIKKNFEFTEIVFVDTPAALAQSNATRKVHVQISSKSNPDVTLQDSIPLSFKYLLASLCFKVSLGTDANYNFFNWSASWIEGFTASNYGTQSLYGDPFVIVFDNKNWGYFFDQQPAPQSAPPNTALQYGNFFVSNDLINIEYMAEIISHEIGHVFDLDHWQDTSGDYHVGNDIWVPVMGSSNLGDMNPDPRFFHWSEGDNPTEVAEVAGQRDFINFAKYLVPIKLRGTIILNSLRIGLYNNGCPFPANNLMTYQDFLQQANLADKYKIFNNPYVGTLLSVGGSVSTRRSRLINTADVAVRDGLHTIPGLIGFPGDFDILKIILKAGTYQVSEYANAPGDQRSQLLLDIHMAVSSFEVSKSQFEKNHSNQNDIYDNPIRVPKDGYTPSPNAKERIDYLGDSEMLQTTYPEGAAEGDSLFIWPYAASFRRPTKLGTELIQNNSNTGSFNTFRCLSSVEDDDNYLQGSFFELKKTSMIYLLVFGAEYFHGQDTANEMSGYGSIGKYHLTIRKNFSNTNLQQILPAVVPPNCYAIDLDCVKNGTVETVIFFTQDPVDYAKNLPYNNVSDDPNAKKYHIVINGKLCKIPFLLQSKEYGLNDTIDERDKKELFAVTSQVPATIGTTKIQEFIIAPEWDL